MYLHLYDSYCFFSRKITLQHTLKRSFLPIHLLHDDLEDIACLLTTDTGDAGSSPHVARWFFQ